MNEVTTYFEFRKALAEYNAAAEIPNSIPGMLTWFAKADAAREKARNLLADLIHPSQHRALYDLVHDLVKEELADEEYERSLCNE